MDKELEKLYTAVSEQFDIGTLESFKSRMSTTEDRRKFYDVVSEQFDIGDYESYEQRLSPGKQNEVSGQGYQNTSPTSTKPLVTSPAGSLTEEGSYVEGYDADSDTYYRNIENVEVTAPVKSRHTFLGNLKNSFMQGLSEVNESLASIPEYIYRIASVPQNLLADAIENNAGEGTASFLRPNYDDASQGNLNPLGALSAYSKQQREISESYASQVEEYEQDIIGSITSGNFKEAGEQIANTIAASIPSMILLASTGSVGSTSQLSGISRTSLNALPFASRSYQELSDNNQLNEYQKLIASGAKGFSEVIFDQEFGTLPLLQSVRDKIIGKEQVKDVAEGYLNKLLNSNGIPASIFKGSVSEMATELSNEIVDVATGEKAEVDFRNILNAGVVGGVADGAISTVGSVSGVIRDSSKRQRASELESQVVSLKEDLDSSTTQEEASVISATIESKVNQLNDIIDSEPIDLTPEQTSLISEINDRQSIIQDSLDNNENLSEVSKQALNEELNDLQQRKDEVLNVEQETTENANIEESGESTVEDGQVAPVGTEVESAQELVTPPTQDQVTPDLTDDSAVQQNETFTETEQVGEVNTDSQGLDVEGEVPTPAQDRITEIRERREVIRQRIRQRLGNLNTGINPEQIADLIELGATYVEEGVVRFSDWTSNLRRDVGDNAYNNLTESNLRDIFKGSVEANGLRVRGFVESSRTNPNVSSETKALVDETNDSTTYAPQVLEDIKQRVEQAPEADRLAKVKALENVTQNLTDADNDAVLAGISLINQYEAEGRHEESARVIESMAKSATVIGQALRQYGEFKSSTKQGYMTLIEGWLKEKGKELNDINRSRIEDLFSKFQEASDAYQKASENRSKDLSKQSLKDFYRSEIELEKANRDLGDYIAKLYGKDLGETLSQILQGNLLTLKSLIINPFSNIVQGGIRFANNTVAWGLDNMFKLFFPELPSSKISPFDRDAIRLGSRGVLEGSRRAFRKAYFGDASLELNKYDVSKRLKPFTALKDVYSSLTSEDFRNEFPSDTETLLSNLAEGTIGQSANLMFRLLPFGDDPFFAQARAERLVEIGKTNKGLSGQELERFTLNPDQESNLEATEYAKSATFQDATQLAKFLRSAMNGVNDVIGKTTNNNKVALATSKVITKTILPFVGTPSSILLKTIRFANPWIPLIELASQWGQFAKLLKAKRTPTNIEKLTNLRRSIAETSAEVIVSGAVITAAGVLVSLGLVSGDMPDEKERTKERSFGFATMPFNHLNISGLNRFIIRGDPTYKQGDKTVSYIPLGLLGAQIGIVESTLGTKLREDFKKSKVLKTSGEMFYEVSDNNLLLDYSRNFFGNLPASVKYFMNQGFVQSTETLIQSLTTGDFDRYGTQTVRTLVNLGIPNQTAQYFRATNEYMRDIYTEDDLQTYANIVSERIGKVEDLPVRYDIWGAPVRQSPEGTNPYVYQVLDIFRSQRILQDDLTYKVFDLYKKTHDPSTIPSGARDFFKQSEFTIKLDKQQRSELTRLVGEERRKLAERALKNYTKDSDNPEKYIKYLKRAYSDGAKRGKRLFMKQLREQGVDIKSNVSLKTSGQMDASEKAEYGLE